MLKDGEKVPKMSSKWYYKMPFDIDTPLPSCQGWELHNSGKSPEPLVRVSWERTLYIVPELVNAEFGGYYVQDHEYREKEDISGSMTLCMKTSNP